MCTLLQISDRLVINNLCQNYEYHLAWDTINDTLDVNLNDSFHLIK